MTTENKPHSPHKPHSLESLVPPLDLCRKIPKGDFGYSALTWNEGYVKGNFVIEQRGLGRYYICPAPTLAEIMEELPKYNENEVTLACVPSFLPGDKGRIFGEAWSVGYTAKSNITDANPATAAMKLWLEINKEEEEK